MLIFGLGVRVVSLVVVAVRTACVTGGPAVVVKVDAGFFVVAFLVPIIGPILVAFSWVSPLVTCSPSLSLLLLSFSRLMLLPKLPAAHYGAAPSPLPHNHLSNFAHLLEHKMDQN